MAGDNQHKGSDQGQQQKPMDQARQMASDVGAKARDLGQSAKEQMEAGASALSSGIRNVASSLRENAPREGMMGTAASRLADTLERGGSYLEQEGVNGLLEDVGTLIRRNPVPAVCIGIGLGFMFAHMVRSER